VDKRCVVIFNNQNTVHFVFKYFAVLLRYNKRLSLLCSMAWWCVKYLVKIMAVKLTRFNALQN